MDYLKLLFIPTLLLLSSVNCTGQGKIFVDDKNIALKGYDVVAYFSQHEAVRGNKDHTVSLDGVTYYFSSAQNADSFKKNPKSYDFAYGGYCAFGMANGAKATSDPKTFKIRDGKLYLFYNDFWEGKPFNTVVPWNSDEKGMMAKANANWKNLK